MQGVNLVFMSSNEVYWKTRWEPSIDGTATPYRTPVCLQGDALQCPARPTRCQSNLYLDRNLARSEFSPPADGGKPENGLTGTIFQVDGYRLNDDHGSL